MEILELARLNLLSPVVLAFALGVIATLVHSDLEIPEALYTGLAVYLLLAIGLKGGAALAATSLGSVVGPVLITVLLGVITPLTTYWAVRSLGGFEVPDAGALAAHYGSVSVVTFLACTSFLDSARVPWEGYAPALVALLEVPAIVVGLLLGSRGLERVQSGPGGPRGVGRAVAEILKGKSVLLLLGGLALGLISGPPGLEKVAPFFVDPFQGVLVLFLLEMGMVAGRRWRDLRQVGPFLLVFGMVAPVVHGTLGAAAGLLAGLSLGGATVLAVLTGSASYIAAPAAVRIALPRANPGFYLTASLAITFPFNLTVGIPLFYAVARRLEPWLGG